MEASDCLLTTLSFYLSLTLSLSHTHTHKHTQAWKQVIGTYDATLVELAADKEHLDQQLVDETTRFHKKHSLMEQVVT